MQPKTPLHSSFTRSPRLCSVRVARSIRNPTTFGTTTRAVWILGFELAAAAPRIPPTESQNERAPIARTTIELTATRRLLFLAAPCLDAFGTDADMPPPPLAALLNLPVSVYRFTPPVSSPRAKPRTQRHRCAVDGDEPAGAFQPDSSPGPEAGRGHRGEHSPLTLSR